MTAPSRSSSLSLRGWARPRIRLLGSAGVAGVGLGTAVAAVAGAYTGDVGFVVSQVFALGAVCLGFGLLGWSGSVFAGRGIENMQRYMDANTNWTEADSRRAMARIIGFGFGVMVGAGAVGTVAA